MRSALWDPEPFDGVRFLRKLYNRVVILIIVGLALSGFLFMA